MAKIIDKAYDAAKRIARTIFRGSPNLITTADLNRQIEALQAQINRLECVTSVRISPLNDYDLAVNLSNHTLRFCLVPYEGGVRSPAMHLFARGCDFNLGSSRVITPAVTFSGSNVSYWRVIAQLGSPALVQFEDDPTHEIAGAEFQDGTSAAAADQMVYPNNVAIFLRSGGSLAENEIVLAEITLDGATGEYVMDTAFDTWNKPVGLGKKNQLSSRYNPKAVVTAPYIGQGFNSLFSHLFRSAVPVGTILPFVGSIDTALPYGWVPCVALVAGVIGNSAWGNIDEEAIVVAYKTLYGSSHIAFDFVDPEGSSQSTNRRYYRITQCMGIDVPDFTDRFLTGAAATVRSGHEGKYYQIGSVGGKKDWKMTKDTLPYGWFYSAHRDQSTVCDGAVFKNAGAWSTGYEGEGRSDSWGSTIYMGKSNNIEPTIENRPPYYALYYIMRVC